MSENQAQRAELCKVEEVALTAREPDDYLLELLTSTAPLTPAQWAYIRVQEAAAEQY